MNEDKQAVNDFLDAFNKLCDEHGLSFNVWPDGEIEVTPWASGEERWMFDSSEEFVYPMPVKK